MHTELRYNVIRRKGVFHGIVCILNVRHRGGLTSFGLLDVHLDDINIVLQEEETVNSGHELPLINFEKWIHLKEAALDALRYRDLPLECDADGLETAMAWLKWQLQAIPVNDDFSQSLQIKSAKLKQDEDTMGRVHVVGRVGFGDIH